MAIDIDNPHAKPRTKAEALEMALQWGHGWSHWNEHCGMTDNTTDNAGADRRRAWVDCAQHDAAEVARLAALWTMLPEGEPSDAVGVDRSRELCHAHGAYGPEGDCFVCDTQIANEARDRALDAFVLRYFEIHAVEKADAATIARWLSGGKPDAFTTDDAMAAINRLVDADVLEIVTYHGIDPSHPNEWTLTSPERRRAIDENRRLEGLRD